MVVIQLVGNTWLKAVFADIADDGAVPFGLFVPVADLDLAFLPGGGGALVPGGGGALVPGVAQSLNQIDKAYGQNHSILDNCHVRVTFATNDERTAKRISETLGTATELRAQRNYAGHRLAPWLGHLMVSRQETARPLLTPGEVMQLPPDEAVVMVSSVAPIKAKKLRYYADGNFKRRVLPPPALAGAQYADAPPLRPDDWSGLAIPPTPAVPATASADGLGNLAADGGGPHRQPELSEAVAYAPELAAPAADLALLDDDDLPLPLPRQLDPAMQRTARLASLDPNDGIEL